MTPKRKYWNTSVNIDVDVSLHDLDDELLLEEVEARKLAIVTFTAKEWCDALADAYQLNDQRKIYEINKRLIDEVTGRII